MTDFAINAEHVHKRFGRVQALRGATLRVPKGSVFGLIGENGAGKTTLFSLCCGFLRADEGQVEILGGPPSWPRLKGLLGALPQDALLSRDLKVQDHLIYFAKLQGFSGERAQAEVARVLASLDLQGLAKRKAGALSHGQQKRVGIAQALLGSPPLILLDEPTAGLDPRHAHDLRQLVIKLRGSATVVVSSHNLQELEAICDEAAFIHHGVTTTSGSMATLTNRDSEVLIELADPNFDLGKIADEFPDTALSWNAQTSLLHVKFTQGPERRSEDVVTHALSVLIAHNYKIASVSKGQSLEQRYLQSTLPT